MSVVVRGAADRIGIAGLHMAAVYQPRLNAIAIMVGSDVLRVPLARIDELVELIGVAVDIGERAHPVQREAGVCR